MTTSLHRQSAATFLEQDSVLVAQVTGDFTLGNSTAICTAILSAWEESNGLQAVIVDLGEVPHMDSSGVGTLLQLRNRAEDSGVPLILYRLQPSSRRLLHRTGLAGLFRICPTVEQQREPSYSRH